MLHSSACQNLHGFVRGEWADLRGVLVPSGAPCQLKRSLGYSVGPSWMFWFKKGEWNVESFWTFWMKDVEKLLVPSAGFSAGSSVTSGHAVSGGEFESRVMLCVYMWSAVHWVISQNLESVWNDSGVFCWLDLMYSPQCSCSSAASWCVWDPADVLCDLETFERVAAELHLHVRFLQKCVLFRLNQLFRRHHTCLNIYQTSCLVWQHEVSHFCMSRIFLLCNIYCPAPWWLAAV